MLIDDLFRHGQEAAKHLFKMQGAVHPMWLCQTAEGGMIPVCLEMPDHPGRDALATYLKKSFRENNIERYVAFMEAWVLETDADQPVPPGSIEHSPDRKEVVLVTAEDKSGEQRSGVFYILRPEHGDPKLSPFKEGLFKGSDLSGRFHRLLATEH